MRTEIGKIQSCKFGLGGYQDAMIGVSFTLGSNKNRWGVADFWGAWATERSEHTKWTEEDRIRELGETVMRLRKILAKAGVDTVEELEGTPVEVTFDGNKMVSWRVLEEVI